MKYSLEITIALSRDEVVKLFDNADNLKHWMPSLQSFEHLSGEAGKPGAKSKMVFLNGKREMAMVETITENSLPDRFCASYEAAGTLNIQENEFVQISKHITKWTSHAEFRFTSLGMKFFAFIMPGAFKKQSLSFMKNFKEFAENQGS